MELKTPRESLMSCFDRCHQSFLCVCVLWADLFPWSLPAFAASEHFQANCFKVC